jgi:hypothetical protein
MLSETKTHFNAPPTVFLSAAPYALLVKQVEALKCLTKEEKASVLSASVQLALATVQFDEKWYLSAYPDIQKAIAKGEYQSGLDHYQQVGFYEGRLPQEIEFDEHFYCSTYSDIQRAVEMGTLTSPKIHFLTKGYAEGRIPSSSYSFATPAAAELSRRVRRHVER